MQDGMVGVAVSLKATMNNAGADPYCTDVGTDYVLLQEGKRGGCVR